MIPTIEEAAIQFKADNPDIVREYSEALGRYDDEPMGDCGRELDAAYALHDAVRDAELAWEVGCAVIDLVRGDLGWPSEDVLIERAWPGIHDRVDSYLEGVTLPHKQARSPELEREIVKSRTLLERKEEA